jgi:aspartyl-tRNA(Asn)/glutamyl-tRNA(Gln) amidotransferase subunit A
MTTTTAVTADPTSVAGDGLPLTISAAAEALRSGALTSVELLRKTMARADRLDPALGTYLVRTDATALEAAERADGELAAGHDRGLLHGIPLGIKDIIATDEAPTTAQSLVLDPAFGEQGDGPVMSRLRAAGAVVTGKTTTMEYATGCPDPDKPFPVPRNPFDLAAWPGGSSSGTGSGVTAGMFLGGLGTDTGGSVRMPAAWCGISGLKQTFGRVPKSGCVPLGFSYDHIGPMTRSARDCAAMLQVMAGHDDSDACSVDLPVEDYLSALTGSVEGMRVGVDVSAFERTGIDRSTAARLRSAVDVFASLGATIVELTLPLQEELATAVLVSSAEALAYHRGDLQARWADYGASTRMAIGKAALTQAADFVQAQRVRRVGVKAMAELFGTVDVVLTPTCFTGAPAVDGLDWGTMWLTINTPYWNAVGNPAISVPMGLTDAGLPVGLQIAGRPFDEATVLRAADAFQQRTDHHLLESPLVLEELSA